MNKKVLGVIVFVILIIIALIAYLSVSQKNVSVDESDAGRVATLSMGDYLNVSLAGNITTGYTWERLPDSLSILNQVGDPVMKPETNSIGSGGIITLKFQAVQTGQMQLKLVYHRPWETGVAPLETFDITVIVK